MKTCLILFKLSTFLYILEPQGGGCAKDKPVRLLPACFVSFSAGAKKNKQAATWVNKYQANFQS